MGTTEGSESRLIEVEPLLNGHTHAAMTLFRGYADDLPLREWLEGHIWPAEARLDDEDVYWGARLACLEMIRSGTTRFWDMYWHPAATARAVHDAGLRAVVGAPLIDGGDPSKLPEIQETARRSLEEIAQAGGDSVAPSLAPHAIYTVSEASLRWIAEFAAEQELPIQIHLSETPEEVERCLEEHGQRPVAYLDGLGLLGPRTVLAHGVWLDEAELERIAERGATVVTNPVANMKLAVGGAFDYPLARRAGVAVGLGTDGPGSNNSLDLLADAKVFALIQKQGAGDPAAVTATETLEVATGRRSRLLAGTLEDSRDRLLVRRDAPELSLGELHAGLVYGIGGGVVDTVIAGGRELMRGGELAEVDEVVAKVRERARRLGLTGAD